MLPYKSFISWNIGPFNVKSFGLMFSIGMLVAVYFALKDLIKKSDKEHSYNLAFIAVIAGLVGARAVYVIQNWQEFSGNFIQVFNLMKGGLGWYGGLIAGLIACFAYIKIKKLDFWKLADVSAAPLAIGQAIGRIGCILGDGGHVGTLTNIPWGFNVNGEIRHVTAWYSFINLMILFFILRKLKNKKHFKGFLFLFYLFYYSITRFIIDIFRIDPRYYGLTLTQYGCIIFFLISGTLLLVNYRKTSRRKTKKSRKDLRKSKQVCPNCKSEKITSYMGGIFGKYKCKKCGYIGVLIVEEDKD